MNKAIQYLCIALSAVLLIGCSKQESDNLSFDYIPVQFSNGDNWSIIDKDGKVLVNEEYSSDATLSRIIDGVFWVLQGDKYQLFSLENPKMPVVDEEFTAVTPFSAGVSAVSAPNQPIRIINTRGETVATLPTTVSVCCNFSENGYAVFIDNDDKCGLLDAKGEVVIPAGDQVFLGGESEGLVLVKKNDRNMVEILDLKGQKKGEIDTEIYEIRTVVSEGKLTAARVGDSESPIVVLDNTGKKLFEIKHSSAYKSDRIGYVDGYMVFCNEDGKFGVANDKGEITIRPKYESMDYIGGGLFGAEKKKRSGIVNAQDEKVVDFKYDYVICLMGQNLLMYDDDEYLLIDKDGKEITSFSKFNFTKCNLQVDYVDIEGLTEAIAEELLDLAMPKTAARMLGDKGLDVADMQYQSRIHHSRDIKGKAEFDIDIFFDGALTEEKTHTEQVDDGWFTTTRTVSDGWVWSDNQTKYIYGTIQLTDVPVKAETICKSIGDKLREASYKEDGNQFTKNINVGGKNYESRITLTPEADKITVDIRFNN